jgi:HEAT repeat protein
MEKERDEEWRALAERLRTESGGSAAFERLAAGADTGAGDEARDADALADVLTAPGQPLWARELAAFRLGLAGDRRAFEALVLLLNHRDPQRCASAAHALARLGDPRTARAAATLATNELRVAYALHPVCLLVELRAPEAVPALITTLRRRLRPHDPYRRVALACVDGLGTLGDPRAAPVLNEALAHPALAKAAVHALGRIPQQRSPG